jgi:hypothetical protein
MNIEDHTEHRQIFYNCQIWMIQTMNQHRKEQKEKDQEMDHN